MDGGPASAAVEPPALDEHATTVHAPADVTWRAVVAVVADAFSHPGAAVYARLVGCRPAAASGPRPLEAGATLPGFRVVAAVPGRELRLTGGHRFSDYTLTFRVDDLGDGRSRLRAESRAAFPGALGAAYRLLVVRTGAHAFLTNRLLSTARTRAEHRG